MNQRTGQILEAAIQEFIDTGEPVSSGWLYKEYDFGIKPAMIRLELDVLEEEGYLEQPHHSAGRVPTDKGYEFFAEKVLGTGGGVNNTANVERSRANDGLKNLFEHHEWANLMGQLSTELGLLSVAADLARDMVYKAGLEQLVNNLDWEDRAALRSVIRDFEEVDERLASAAGRMGDATADGPQVFIGKKSPVTRSENLSVVCGNYKVGDTVISIFAIGPKRMDYKKTIRIFKNL
jgi:transcriptional regulator of heat shock response